LEKRRKRKILPATLAQPHLCALPNLTQSKRCAKPHLVCGDVLFVHTTTTTTINNTTTNTKLITSRPKEGNLAS